MLLVQEDTYTPIDAASIGFDFVHAETTYADWDREGLLFQMGSTPGPCLAIGDANGDGRDDVYVGGAGGQAGTLYTQVGGGRFSRQPTPVLEADAKYEDADAVWFDADGDGDADLLVTSGSSEFAPAQLRLRDRLYYNEGKGVLTAAPRLPMAGRAGHHRLRRRRRLRWRRRH